MDAVLQCSACLVIYDIRPACCELTLSLACGGEIFRPGWRAWRYIVTIEDDLRDGPLAVSASAASSPDEDAVFDSDDLPFPQNPGEGEDGDRSGSIFGLRPVIADSGAEDLLLVDDDEDFLTQDTTDESPDTPVFSEGSEPRWLGVRFSKNGQVFFIPDQQSVVRKGTKVLVRQESGLVLGEVQCIIEGHTLPEGKDISSPDKKIVGIATAQDIACHAENAILSGEAKAFCKTCIRQRDLDMKLVDVEVLHDRSKIVFYFTAPSRIDFRELVKDLVRNYRTRIELRQIGVRHESQMIGGLGNCGMVCCCHGYLRKFAPVTIKMAKEQNLFLNPAKLSGMCGRLLCCLSFEQDNYEEFNRRCPKIGKKYVTEEKGAVKILRANMFSQSLSVQAENGEEIEFSLDEWEGMRPRRAEPQGGDATRSQEHSPEDTGSRPGRYKKGSAREAKTAENRTGASGPEQSTEHAGRKHDSGQKHHKRGRPRE